MISSPLAKKVFDIKTTSEFNDLALGIFKFQYEHNAIYHSFCKALKKGPAQVKHYTELPFLPIEFFKQHRVVCGEEVPQLVFTSSGTSGTQTSRHYVPDPRVYRESFSSSFKLFNGSPSEYHILALLPGYLERTGSSLVYMVHDLIVQSRSEHSGFYLDELEHLQQKIISLKNDPRKILLIGVSFALLEMAETYPVQHPRLSLMETGGMKGRRKELVRDELHLILKKSFLLNKIGSEYGMTELLSQAYSIGEGIFAPPPWMKILIRETNDPLSLCSSGITGGINVIDLANIYSCSFIATQDLGKLSSANTFEVTGRFDNSDIRGCNLLVS